MSYTILTIPFNLKEKKDGKYLEKGFLIQDADYYKSLTNTPKSSPFIHVCTFSDKAIKKASIDLYIKQNITSYHSNNLFTIDSFFDKKYLNSVHDYINLAEIKTLNNVKQKNEEDSLKIPYDKLKLNYTYVKASNSEHGNEINEYNNKILPLNIKEVKLFLNSSKTNSAIGFGFIEIVLNWDFNCAIEMVEGLNPFAELFRFYSEDDKKNDKKNKFYVFNPFDNENSWNRQIENIILENENKFENKNILEKDREAIKLIIKNLNALKIIDTRKEPISFKSLVDSLLQCIIPNELIENVFDFNDRKKTVIKPYILHLTNFLDKNNNLDKLQSKIYRLLRISGAENSVINNQFEFLPVTPDFFVKQYILNEGAFIIEGVSKSSELINKYFPAFLFALNQKYLFNYMQERINELKTDSNGKFKSDNLKTLQEKLIYSEFSQIFTSISNYNEIDMFFEKMRKQFKIEDLKQEYFASINGISQITQIKENEKLENEKNKNEEIEKLRSDRLNLIVFLLTIAQVWSGLYGSFPLAQSESGWILNLLVYAVFILIGCYYYFLNFSRKENQIRKKYEALA